MDFITTEKLKIKKIEGAGTPYELWAIYHPELGFPTYGILNVENDVIEHLQPNLHNARNVMKEFEGWLNTSEAPSAEVLAQLDM